MGLLYGKTTAVALASFLMTSTVSVQAMEWGKDGFIDGDCIIKFGNGDYLKESLPIQDSYKGSDISKREISKFELYTNKLVASWKYVQNGTYKTSDTFMDILMGAVNFQGTRLSSSSLSETSQFRAILKGMCKSVNIQENSKTWQSISKLDDVEASIWFKAMIEVRSKDTTFFNSYFNLTWLSLSYNNLTSVDVSKNTLLTELFLSNNQLTSVDVSKNTLLTELYLDNNQLESVDVSKNTALTGLYLDNNQLASVDVRQNTLLTGLNLGDNQLKSVDVSKNTLLTVLGLSYNNLTSVDVSQNTLLTWLYLQNNPSLKKEAVTGVTSNIQVN